MNNYKEVILDNGLTMYLYQDKTKNRCIASIYILAGGKDTTFYIDNEEKHVLSGTAHFLEHYLLEHSIYGNAMELFKDEYVNSNGATSSFETNYYISTVHDFKELYIKLLNIVNNPVFDEKAIDLTRKPIISEIDRKNDDKYIGYYKTLNNAIYKNDLYNITLGDKQDILNMDVNNLKLFHEAFYQASNQVIVITGNFDDDIVNLTKEIYSSFKQSNLNVKKKELNETSHVKNSYVEYKKDIKDPYVTIAYKFDISNLTPVEKNKLDFYLSYIDTSNFSMESNLYQELVNNKIINFSIDYNISVIENILVLKISNVTNNDEFIARVKSQINNLVFNEEIFKRWKNRTIINRINKLDKLSFKENNFITNLLNYNYKVFDSLEFIKSLNLDECKMMINNLDFNNFTVVKNSVE